MNDPKIVVMMAVKNGEPWISKALKSASEVCTEIVVFDDGSTDNTLEICKSFPKVVDIKINETNMPYDEARNRNFLFQLALKRNPDYILHLDADEVLQPNAKKVLFKELLARPDASVFEFQILGMWDKPNMYRYDGLYADTWGKRMVNLKNQPKNLSIRNTAYPQNIHSKHIPQNARGWLRPVKSRVKILHYSSYDASTRQQKYQNYNRKDSNNKNEDYYKRLLESPSAFSGNYGLEFRYLPKGMFDDSIPLGRC